MTGANSKSTNRWLVVILFVATVLRVGCAFWIESRLEESGRRFFIEGDAEGYWELGQRIARWDDYAVHEPPRYVHRMPGFPTILAISNLVFPDNMFAARLLLSLLGVVVCWLVFKLGSQLDSPQTGLIAAAICAVSPMLVGFSPLILSETAFATSLVVSLLAVKRLIDVIHTGTRVKDRRKILFQTILVGTLIGLGVYIKPSWILIAPCFVAFICLAFRYSKRSIVSGIVIILSLFVVLLPWGVRNFTVSDHFTLTTFWMGPSLYDGLQPGATGASDMRFYDKEQLPARFSEYEVDRIYRDRAVQLAFNDPLRVVRLAGSKFLRFWNLWPNADQFQSGWIRLGMGLFYVPTFLLCLIGIWEWRHRFWPLAICLGPVLYFTGLHLIFVSSLRYRLPAEYPLMILVAVGLQAILSKFTEEKTAV